jgi:hypothetical protein
MRYPLSTSYKQRKDSHKNMPDGLETQGQQEISVGRQAQGQSDREDGRYGQTPINTDTAPPFNSSNIHTTRRTQHRSAQDSKKTAEDVGSTHKHIHQVLKTWTIKCGTSRHGAKRAPQFSTPDGKLCHSLFRGSGGDLGFRSRERRLHMLTQSFVLEVKCYVGLYAPRRTKIESKKKKKK